MYRTRNYYKPMTDSEDDEAHVLQNASLGNLTLSTIPDVSTRVVVAPPIDSNLSEKITELMKDPNATIIRVAGGGVCPENIIAEMPRSVLVKLLALLTQYRKCNTEVTTAIYTIKGLLVGSEPMIEVPRLLFEQVGLVVDGLKITEGRIKQQVAITKMITNGIATDDIQTPADPEMFESEMDSSKSPLPIIDLVADVIKQAPQSIGLPSSNKFGSDVTVDVDKFGVSSGVSSRLLDEAFKGMKDLYSGATLLRPLEKMSIGDMTRGAIDYEVQNVVVDVTMVEGELKVTKKPYILHWESTLDKDQIDGKVSIMELLDQTDAALDAISENRTVALASPEATAIIDKFKKAWTRIKNMKLPTARHISVAKDILSTGLVVAGKVLGKEKLASVGSMIDGFDLSPLNIPKDARVKSMFNLIPNLMEVGYANILSRTVSNNDIIRSAATLDVQIKSKIPNEKPKLSYSCMVKRSLSRKK